MGNPAFFAFEDADAGDGFVFAQVEPVPGSVGDDEQVAGVDFDVEDAVVGGVDGENAAAVDDKADFVFVVFVFFVEFGQEFVEVGGCRREGNDVGAQVAAAFFEGFDFVGEDGQDAFLFGFGLECACFGGVKFLDVPDFVVEAVGLDEFFDLLGIGEDGVGTADAKLSHFYALNLGVC